MSDSIEELATKPETIVENACGALLDAFVEQSAPRLKKFTDQLYSDLLDSVQEYLRENANWNLSAQIEQHRKTTRENYELRDRIKQLEEEAHAAALKLRECREALRGAVGALEFSRDYHKDLGNEDQAFAQDRLDAARKALGAK